jgi:hypothetical protein
MAKAVGAIHLLIMLHPRSVGFDQPRRYAAQSAKLLSKDEARRIAVNIAKLPEL